MLLKWLLTSSDLMCSLYASEKTQCTINSGLSSHAFKTLEEEDVVVAAMLDGRLLCGSSNQTVSDISVVIMFLLAAG